MMNNKKILLLSVCAFFTGPADIYAQVQSTDMSESIRSGVASYIGSVAGADESPVVRFSGDVKVENKNEYYTVTLPEISLNYPGEGSINAGIPVANITPKSDGDWRVTLALPQSMVSTSADGVPSGVLSFGTQKITGNWRPNIGFFTDLNAEFKDVRFVDVPGRIDLRAAEITRKLSVIPKGQRSSAVSGTFVAGNINGSLPGINEPFSVADITFGFKHEGVNLENYVNYIKQGLASGDFLGSLQKLWAGDAVTQGAHELVASGIAFSDAIGKKSGISRVKLTNSINNAENGNSDIIFTAEVSDFSGVSDGASGIKKILFSGTLKNVNRSVFRTGGVSASDVNAGAVKTEELPVVGAEYVSFDEIISLLMTSGAGLTLNEFNIEFVNGAYIRTAGAVIPEPVSSLKYIGKLDLAVKNPDKIAEEISSVINSYFAKNLKDMPASGQIKMFTAMITSLGNTQNDAGGSPVTNLSLELTREGKLLVNGREAVPNLGIPGLAMPSAMPTAVVPAPAAPGAIVEIPAAE